MKVAVLLSTFDSEQYLRAQIDSILSQSFTDLELHIRDDGSSDGTLDILAEYIDLDSRVFLLNDDGSNRRSAGSFLQLLSKVEADYYFFCDHDDVWLPKKIELTLSALQMSEDRALDLSAPVLVATDLAVVDSELNVIHPSFAQYSGIYPQLLQRFVDLAATNYITGCTAAFNRSLRDRALKLSTEFVEMHDHWLSLVCLKYGGRICYLPIPTLLYRQHDKNVVGAKARRFPASLLMLPDSLKVLGRYIKQAKSIEPNTTARAVIAAKIAYRLKYLVLKWL